LVESWVRQLYDHIPIRVSAIYTAMQVAAGLPLPSDPPYVEDAVALLDKILAQADPSVKRFIEVWYCRGGSMPQKAAQLGISREALYCQRKIQIEYLRDRLRGCGLEI
jgi:predicted DNA-binding transcriptional regulator YafY